VEVSAVTLAHIGVAVIDRGEQLPYGEYVGLDGLGSGRERVGLLVTEGVDLPFDLKRVYTSSDGFPQSERGCGDATSLACRSLKTALPL
jgi:hypothetical protein